MSTAKTRLDLDTAAALAQQWVAPLAPACERIEVAGSIRRGKPQVGDIELVCIPKTLETILPGQLDLFGGTAAPQVQRVSRLDTLLDGFIRAGSLHNKPPFGVDAFPAWGERYKKLWTRHAGEWVQVDLFITTPEAWGAIFCIRTGPADFSAALVAHFKHATPYRQQDGVLVVEATGDVVPVPEEADYFRLAGIDVIPPGQRSVQTLRAAVWRQQFQAARTKPAAKEKTANVRYTVDDALVRAYIRERLERAVFPLTNADLMPVWAIGLGGQYPACARWYPFSEDPCPDAPTG